EEVISEPVESGGRALMAMPPGRGKTAMAVEVVRRLGARVIMITAPVNKFGGWRRHFAERMPELPFYELNAKTQDGLAPLLKAGEPMVVCTGWEYGRGVVRYKKGPDGKRLMIPKGTKQVPVVDKVIREPLDWSKV